MLWHGVISETWHYSIGNRKRRTPEIVIWIRRIRCSAHQGRSITASLPWYKLEWRWSRPKSRWIPLNLRGLILSLWSSRNIKGIKERWTIFLQTCFIFSSRVRACTVIWRFRRTRWRSNQISVRQSWLLHNANAAATSSTSLSRLWHRGSRL